MITQGHCGGLTSVEQSLVDHVSCGEWLDLAADDEAVDEAAMRSWDASRTCRATVIRDILRGRLATDSDPHGLRLRGARISGRLDLENLTTNVNIEFKDCILEEGVLARNASLASVALTKSRLEHPTEPPLDATRLSCSMLDLTGARITGHAEAGAVRLNDAHISSIFCNGASLRNESGPALYGDSLQVGQNMLLRGLTAIGAGELGAVCFVGVHIGGSLEFDRASLRNESGPALYGDSLQVGQNMLLRRFTATGAGEPGAVRLIGAHIDAIFDCFEASLRNESGPALYAPGLRVGLGMFFRRGFTATGGGTSVVVDLTSAHIGETLTFNPAGIKHVADPHLRLAVNGLTYAGVPGGTSKGDWLALLRVGTRSYAAQPYQQLATGYKALGDERQARKILIAQRDDELTRAGTRWSERLWGWITKITLGYGYKPWRALLFLAAVVGISCVLAVALGSHGALAETNQTATPGRPCTVIQQVSVGLDLNLPVGTSIARTDCSLTENSDSATATWLTAVSWVLRLLAWVFAALFIAGFTSAVRKT